MPESSNKTLRALGVELTFSYPFPALMGIFISFFAVASYSLLTMHLLRSGIHIPSEWNSTIINTRLENNMIATATMTVSNSFFSVGTITLFFIPLLFAFAFAQGFSTGQIRTLLSYPIGRGRLFLIKFGSVVAIITISLAGGALLAIACLMPYSLDFALLLPIMIGSFLTIFLVSSVCVFIAVLSRSAPITAFLGIAFWAGITIFAMNPFSPFLLRQIFFPWLLTLIHIDTYTFTIFGAVNINELLYGYLFSIAISLVLILISYLRFTRLEV